MEKMMKKEALEKLELQREEEEERKETKRRKDEWVSSINLYIPRLAVNLYIFISMISVFYIFSSI